MKRFARFLAATCLAGFIFLNILALNHARAMLLYAPRGERTAKPESLTWPQRIKVLFLGVTVPRPTGSELPGDLAPEAQRLFIPTTAGATLGAWSCDRGPGRPWVILFHGYATDKTSLLREARIFLDLEMSVLLVDFRGSGESSERYTTIGCQESDDVTAAFRFVQKEWSPDAVILFGRSMGAAAILRAIRKDVIEPDGIILEAVFDNLLHTIRNRFRAMGVPSFPSADLLLWWGGRLVGFNGFAHNPVEYAAAARCPALFIHGANDPRASLDEGRRVFAAVPGDKYFLEIPAAGHGSYAAVQPEKWIKTVAQFCGRVAAAK